MATAQVPTKEEIVKKIKRMLEKDKDVKAWFDGYFNSHWDSFINTYAEKKVNALQYANKYEEESLPLTKTFNDIARVCLEAIQQAKLFRMQCEWRADELALPIVKITYDFEILANDVFQCPFLTPVTMEEVNAYIEFLKSPKAEDYSAGFWDYNIGSWQKHETLWEYWDGEFEDSGKLPNWYTFYDEYFHDGKMFDRQDWRGSLESYYRAASVDKTTSRPKKWDVELMESYAVTILPPPPPSNEAAPPSDPPPVTIEEHEKPIPYGPYVHMEFARRFEKPEDAEKIVNLHKSELKEYDFEEYDVYYEFLKSVNEPLKFEAANDWKESLKKTVMNYRFAKIAEALPRIWRQYNREIGDPEAYMHRLMAKSDDLLQRLDRYQVRQYYVKSIVEGRIKLGEPGDLDF